MEYFSDCNEMRDENENYDDIQDKKLKKCLKTMNSNTTKSIKNLEKKVSDMINLMDSTMNTWMMMIHEVKENQKKMDNRLLNMEKDIKLLKNQRNIREDNIPNQSRSQYRIENIIQQQQQQQQYHYQQQQTNMNNIEDETYEINEKPNKIYMTNHPLIKSSKSNDNLSSLFIITIYFIF